MKKSASLFAPHLRICIAENKTDGGKEVTLPGAVAPYDDIVLRREGLDDRLVFVAVVMIRGARNQCAQEPTF